MQHPQAVWLLIPLAVCMTAVLASLSRGGILALGVGLGMAALMWKRRGGGTQSLMALVMIPVLALGLLSGMEPHPHYSDWSKINCQAKDVLPSGRQRWDVFCRFPLLGTGLGTFPVAEPLCRPHGVDQTITHEHAHNEYMEALVEGGIVRFALTVVLIWLVLRRGWQALQTRQRGSDQGLILGAWAACIALAVQSFGEFGIHLPAIAGLLAVTAGYLVRAGR